jgi:hypothetical protein
MQKNLFEDITLPDRVDEVIDSAIKRGHRTFLIKRSISVFLSMCILIIGMFGTCYASPSAAKVLSKIPFVGSVFSQFTDKGLKSVSKQGMTYLANMEVTKQNATVALKEIYYDKSGISFGLALKGINPYTSSPQYFLYYKDNLISGSFTGEINDISKDIYLVSLKTTVPSDLPDKFDLKLIVKETTDFKREFEFNVPLSRAAGDESTKEYTIMKGFKSNDKSVLIKKILFTSASVSVDFEYTRPIEEHEPELSLKLFDDKGERIVLDSFTGTNQIYKNNRTDSYHAVFNPVSAIPSKLRLDIVEAEGERTVFSTKIEVK